MTEEQTNDTTKTKDLDKPSSRLRSPNYPFVNLEDALKRLVQLREVAKHHFASVASARQAWKYGKGAGNQTIAALKSYGLIDVQGEGDKRQVRISEAGQKILANHSQKAELLKEAALKPEIFNEVWNKYEADMPKRPVIAEYLVFEREPKFNPDSVETFLDRFFDTIKFANLAESDKIDTDDEDKGGTEDEEEFEEKPLVRNKKKRQQSEGNEQVEELNFKLSPDSRVEIVFTSNQKVTQNDIDLLRQMLFLQKFAFPTKEEVARVPTRAAIWKNNDSDQPVLVTGEAGLKDGKMYYKIEGSETGVPEDELEFEDEK